MRLRRYSFLLIVTLVLTLGILSPLFGQGETIITLAVASGMDPLFDDALYDAFEAAHPGVKVVPVSVGDDAFYPWAAWELEAHLDGAQKYASSADVLWVHSPQFSVEATRAGYFLDLGPLINSDPSFDADDFFPAIWQSFQWDNGFWAIPVSSWVEILLYNVKAFDDAGLAYPNENWTFDDLANATRALTVLDADGNVVIPGFDGLRHPGLFLHAFLGESFYDPSTIPSPPRFDQPDLPALLEGWAQLQQDLRTERDYDYNAIPLVLDFPQELLVPTPNGEVEWAASLLPGAIAGLEVQGFAVSQGTLNPELAYALANYLSTSPEVFYYLLGHTPARRSLVGVTPEGFFPQLPEEMQGWIDQAVENGVPASELRYTDYLISAIDSMMTTGIDAQTALQEAEENALRALDTAAEHRATDAVVVATAVPTPSLGSDQIVLHFGMSFFSENMANPEEWDRLIADFLAQNPNVGNVDLKSLSFPPEEMEQLDCYYQPWNIVPSMQREDYLNLDPFMDADPAFASDDFIGSTLAHMQRDNQTWGYPIILQPEVLWYNAELFERGGLPSPEAGWTVDAFRDALDRLRPMLEDEDDPVLGPETSGSTYLLLIAAYGGVPYDYRTDPPTINFTDPAVIEAIRQVLDLAKAGYIAYYELLSDNGPGRDLGAPITTDILSADNWRLQTRVTPGFEVPYRLAHYPRGSQFTPLAYDIGAAYILDDAQNPEACYRWITHIARRPDLFDGVPARLSQINDATLATAHGEDVAKLYQTYAEMVEQPDALIFPSQPAPSASTWITFVELLWLNRAFDRYVLQDGDLEAELTEAQQMAMAFRECASSIPQVNLAQLVTPEEMLAYLRQFADCAIGVDPSFREHWQFSIFYENQS